MQAFHTHNQIYVYLGGFLALHRGENNQKDHVYVTLMCSELSLEAAGL